MKTTRNLRNADRIFSLTRNEKASKNPGLSGSKALLRGFAVLMGMMSFWAGGSALAGDPVVQPTPAPVVFTASSTADTSTVLNNFRAAIGGVDNGNVASPQNGGRREINWDGVKLDGTDFNGNTTVIVPGKTVGIPVNRFQTRGVVFAEVYAVSGDGFASANSGVAGQFPAFSPNLTFAMFDDNGIELSFVLPSAATSTPIPAAVRGFGVVFLDVEKANTTSIEYFNGNVSLGKFFAPPGASGQAEFLGVLFNAPIVTNVEIKVGTAEIFSFKNSTITPGKSDLTLNAEQGVDLADTDDFLYSEPVALLASVSAASYKPATLASEAITAAFGPNLATGTAVAGASPLPTSLAGTNLKVRDSQGTERLAPLFFVAPGQINFQVPPGTLAGDALITATSSDNHVAVGQVQIASVAPGLFSANADGQGIASAVVLRVKANGTQSYEPMAAFNATQQKFVAVPIDMGADTDLVYLILFGTGVRFASSLQYVTATVGGISVPVLYAGPQSGYVGLDQINLRLPRTLINRGEVDIILTVDGKTANTIKVNIK